LFYDPITKARSIAIIKFIGELPVELSDVLSVVGSDSGVSRQPEEATASRRSLLRAAVRIRIRIRIRYQTTQARSPNQSSIIVMKTNINHSQSNEIAPEHEVE
jgi:hypothetical protein